MFVGKFAFMAILVRSLWYFGCTLDIELRTTYFYSVTLDAYGLLNALKLGIFLLMSTFFLRNVFVVYFYFVFFLILLLWLLILFVYLFNFLLHACIFVLFFCDWFDRFILDVVTEFCWYHCFLLFRFGMMLDVLLIWKECKWWWVPLPLEVWWSLTCLCLTIRFVHDFHVQFLNLSVVEMTYILCLGKSTCKICKCLRLWLAIRRWVLWIEEFSVKSFPLLIFCFLWLY